MEDKKIELISAKGAMGVTEFALLYFPDCTPEIAYKRMWVWIRTSRGLKEKLLAAGWVKFQKLYTPKQVACLVEHLGGTLEITNNRKSRTKRSDRDCSLSFNT